MAITFDTEKYLAKVDFTEAELDRLCVKKAEVIGVSSRQSVKILCEGVEYEDVPVWIHTDCGARHWYLKGLEAVEVGQEPPIAPTAAEYFKDAALMFPFPGGAYIRIGGSDVQTITPHVLAVFSVIDNVTVAQGVIGVLSSVTTEGNEEAFPTYKPFLRFRIRHKSGSTYLYSRTFLYDLVENRVAKSPTIGVDGFKLPIIELKDIPDDGVQNELSAFLGNAPYLPYLTPVELEAWHQGTTGYGYYSNMTWYTSIYPFQNNFAISSCSETTYNPGWEGTYSPYSWNLTDKCGYGSIVMDLPQDDNHAVLTDTTHYSATMDNVKRYAYMTVGRYQRIQSDYEADYLSCLCGTYHSGTVYNQWAEKVTVLMGEEETEVVLADTATVWQSINPVCPPNTLNPLSYSTGSGGKCNNSYVAERQITGKIWYELGVSFHSNFFLEAESYNFLQVATYSREATSQSWLGPFDIGYSVIENNFLREAFDGYSGRGWIECGPAMTYIAEVMADYHEQLVDSNYFYDIEVARRAHIGDAQEYSLFYHPGKINLEVDLQGLYFVPFNREIALLEES